jgi:hypothetical protein
VEWLAERDDVRPHPDYAAWKASTLSEGMQIESDIVPPS